MVGSMMNEGRLQYEELLQNANYYYSRLLFVAKESRGAMALIMLLDFLW